MVTSQNFTHRLKSQNYKLNKCYHVQVLQKRFHLDGHTIGFHSQTLKSQYFLTRLLCQFGVCAVKPLLTATSVIRSPRYGHFFWPPGKTAIHFPVKKKPSLIRSPVNKANFFGPLVTVLTGFHCITFVWFFHFNLLGQLYF